MALFPQMCNASLGCAREDEEFSNPGQGTGWPQFRGVLLKD